MSVVSSIYSWLCGDGLYCTLPHCMGGDTLWITITVVLDLLVVVGYGIIAVHWWKNQRTLSNEKARTALGMMRNIFILCALCGYAFNPIKIYWPLWRLYDIFMVGLVFYTWRYALSSRHLKVIYSELDRSKKLSMQLDEARAESQRKTYFLNAMSHDLRNPLYGLTLQADVAEVSLDTHDTAALHEAIMHIKAGALETTEMLNGFLELARLDWTVDPLTLSEFDARWLAEKVILSHEQNAKEKELSIEAVGVDEIMIKSDRVKLERILGNLVANAIKFTSKGGVKVIVEEDPRRRGVVFHVVDTGEGIAPENHARLFEEFYQVKNHERNRRKGFGLGLPIAQRLARQLGGHMELQSTLGQGSRFSVFIPL